MTMVFCMVDGGKAFAARHRRDAPAVHRTLAAVVRSVLRQVRLQPLASSAKGCSRLREGLRMVQTCMF